jgi:hypothetical protein
MEPPNMGAEISTWDLLKVGKLTVDRSDVVLG